MSVVFRNAKAGDKITFVLNENEAAKLRDGRFLLEVRPHEITALEPAPFDWNTVKPGMAFRYNGIFESLRDKILRYIGRASKTMNDVYEVDGGGGSLSINWLPHREELTRAPEHDIEVQPCQ